MTKRLKELMELAENWPPAAQEAAASFLESLQGYVSLGLSDDDIAALDRSEQDVRSGRLASDKEVREVFDQHRRA